MSEMCFVELDTRHGGKPVRYFCERETGEAMTFAETVKDIWDGQFDNKVCRVLVLEESEGMAGRWRDATGEVAFEMVARCYNNGELRQADLIESELGCAALVEIKLRLRLDDAA